MLEGKARLDGQRGGQGGKMKSGESNGECVWAANLPTCFWETGNLHPEHGTAWTRSSGAVRRAGEVLLAPGTTSKLHCQSLTLEITAICCSFGQQSLVCISSRLSTYGMLNRGAS